MTMTPRLALPFIAPGQAQKELLHNESLQILDAIVAAAVEDVPAATPPTAPDVGSCYILAPVPAGAWTAYPNHLAQFSEGGWRFIAPRDGMTVHIRSNGMTAVFHDGAWSIGGLTGTQVAIGGKKVLGSRGFAIANPSGGSVVDAEARSALNDVLAALREHGLIEI